MARLKALLLPFFLLACGNAGETYDDRADPLLSGSTSSTDPSTWPLTGATFPHHAAEIENPALRSQMLAAMTDMSVTSVRLKLWDGWSMESLISLMEDLEHRDIDVTLVVSHRYNPLVDGYPDDPCTSARQLRERIADLRRFSNLWGFDLRAEPFKKKLRFDPEQEISWLKAMTAVTKAIDHRYQVYSNLMETTLEYVPRVAPFSDYVAVNYYYPRGKELRGLQDAGLVGEDLYVSSHVIHTYMAPAVERYMHALGTYNTFGKPVIIAQFGEHRGPRSIGPSDGAEKPWVDEAGQAAWYEEFFSAMRTRDEVKGYMVYDMGVKSTGFPVYEPGVATPVPTDCVDVIRSAYERIPREPRRRVPPSRAWVNSVLEELDTLCRSTS